jgi:hypothetical protein
MSSHLKRKFFAEVIFLLKYHQNLQVLKRRSIEKKREKILKKEKERERKKKGKRGRKRKAPRVSSNKGDVNILRG